MESNGRRFYRKLWLDIFYTKYLMQKTKIRYLNIRKRNELMVKNRKRRLRSVILFILENETVLIAETQILGQLNYS